MAIDTRRVRAPELRGRGGWVNAPGGRLSLAELRGRFVVLDFWTFCCVNCLHVLDELRPLEAELADVVTVIGVHSPKFAHEADHAAVVAAVERHDVRHPVLDDPGLETWGQYAVRAWPTLVVVDPEGYVVAQASGEGHVAGLASLVRELAVEHEARGTLRRGLPDVAATQRAPTTLRFPGKACETPHGLLVSDTARHQLALLSPDGADVVRRIGDGARGRSDGVADIASFNEPQGVCLMPNGEVVVADAGNHLLRAVDLGTGVVRTVAGTGEQWRRGATRGPALDRPLSTPWDVAWWRDGVAIAMAGTHQIWHWDPATGEVGAVAGTMAEGLRDGPAGEACLAQPSGLAVGADGALWFADSETSALRCLRDDDTVSTAVGTGLFDFGHRDGPAGQARLQHPLGLAVAPDGTVLVADTYNGAIRCYDPARGEVTTLATGLAEPSDVLVVDGALWVVESAAHVVRPVAAEPRWVDAGAHRTQRPATDVAPGGVRLTVVFTPPPGQHLDERDGPATRLTVGASSPDLLLDGAGTSTVLRRDLVLGDVPAGVLHVSAVAASCDEGVEHPACHLTQQDWGIPLRISPDGSAEITLVLRGAVDG